MIDDNGDEGNMIGYARVSTAEQSVGMQVEALKRAGVPETNIFSECMSGSTKNRPQLAIALRAVMPGDTFVVWKLDRLARSMTHLLEVINLLDDEGVKFRSLTEGIETETPMGRLFLHFMGAIAQFERDLIRERTQAGVDKAKSEGVRFGADYKLRPTDVPDAWRMVNEEGKLRKHVAKHYGITTQTLARRLKQYEAEQSGSDVSSLEPGNRT